MKPLHHLSIGIASDHAGYELKSAVIKTSMIMAHTAPTVVIMPILHIH